MAAAQEAFSQEAFGLHCVSERAPDGQPLLDEQDEEEVAQTFPRVSFVLGDGRDLGEGTLFITSRWACFSWLFALWNQPLSSSKVL